MVVADIFFENWVCKVRYVKNDQGENERYLTYYRTF